MQEQVKERKSRAALIGALAALSVFCCGLFTGVPAAVLAWDDLKAMDTGRLPTKNRTLVQIAMWFAIGGSVLWGLVFFVAFVTQSFEEVLNRDRNAVQESRTPEPEPGDKRVNSQDGATMVFVPAGAFDMGTDHFDGMLDEYNLEKPRHRVSLTKGFWIYQTELKQSIMQ